MTKPCPRAVALLQRRVADARAQQSADFDLRKRQLHLAVYGGTMRQIHLMAVKANNDVRSPNRTTRP